MGKLQTKIHEIASGRCAIFCGAGISFNSGIPTVNPYISYVLDSLGATKEEKKCITKAKLPFEALMQELFKASTNIDQLVYPFSLGSPNLFHQTIAQLAVRGLIKTVCTTNFDTLFEQAFSEIGLNEDQIAIYTKSSKLDAIYWNDDKIKLVKIHGSIEDAEELAITIQRVAKRSLVAKRTKFINDFLSPTHHDRVWFFGYSCSDYFDIVPGIEAFSGTQDIIFVDHHEEKDHAEELSKKEVGNPFKKVSAGHRFYVDTDLVVSEINRIILNENKCPERTSVDWKSSISEWGKANADSDDRILYTLLSFCEAYTESYPRAKQALESSPNAVGIYSDLGHICNHLGDVGQSRAYLNEGLSHCSESSEGGNMVYTPT